MAQLRRDGTRGQVTLPVALGLGVAGSIRSSRHGRPDTGQGPSPKIGDGLFPCLSVYAANSVGSHPPLVVLEHSPRGLDLTRLPNHDDEKGSSDDIRQLLSSTTTTSYMQGQVWIELVMRQ